EMKRPLHQEFWTTGANSEDSEGAVPDSHEFHRNIAHGRRLRALGADASIHLKIRHSRDLSLGNACASGLYLFHTGIVFALVLKTGPQRVGSCRQAPNLEVPIFPL